jgi:pimeloyl-ACP methyl ester carboxylesterase
LSEQYRIESASIAVRFGARDRLFGMYTPPKGAETRRACGVLLCSPIGWHGSATHRTYRFLAERLAAQGFPVLRFDYDGTGDSAGSEMDPDRLAAWIGSIQESAAYLREVSGAPTISLFGVHFGATLAAHAAGLCEQRGTPIGSIVLWAALLSGKEYLRHIRAYRLLNLAAPEAVMREEDASGFTLTPSTVRDLLKLGPLFDQGTSCRDILLLARDDQHSLEKFAKRLASRGINAELKCVPGYAAMMQDPQRSRLPSEVMESVIAWLSQRHAVDTAALPQPKSALAQPIVRLETRTRSIQECAFFFGRDRELFAVMSSPSGSTPKASPMIVWLSTGADHRIGPNRMFVPLARTFAEIGFASVRFDPRGVGDSGSAPQPDAHAYSEFRITEVLEAVDGLARDHGALEFILVGVCSAAFVAFHAAKRDPRVISVVLINPQTLVWHEGDSTVLRAVPYRRSLQVYRQRLFSFVTWVRLLSGDLSVSRVMSSLFQGAVAGVKRQMQDRSARTQVPHARAFDALRSLLARGVEVSLVFSDTDYGLEYVERYLGRRCATVAVHKNFSLDVVEGADHTFSQQWAKERLASLLMGCILRLRRDPTR